MKTYRVYIQRRVIEEAYVDVEATSIKNAEETVRNNHELWDKLEFKFHDYHYDWIEENKWIEDVEER